MYGVLTLVQVAAQNLENPNADILLPNPATGAQLTLLSESQRPLSNMKYGRVL